MRRFLASRALRWGVAAGVVATASFGAVALASGTDPADQYRLATATVDDVVQSVAASGTVDYVNRADVAFATDGTLAELAVAQGDQVTAGQVLATLDLGELQTAVDAAEADLASANAAVAADEEEQLAAVEDDDESQQGQVTEQQQAVRAAQSAASQAIAAAKEALAAQTAACAQAYPAEEATTEQVDSGACTESLAAVTGAQDAVAGAQDELQAAIDTLAGALAQAASSAAPAGGGESEASSSAAGIATGQAAVDTAAAELLAAEQALARGTLTAPIAGTVAAVEATAGGGVTAGTTVVVLIGAGAAVVETTVPAEQIGDIEVGQVATVTPVGSATEFVGAVTRIGLLADAAAETTAYPVTITVDEPTAEMPAGSAAGVAIVVATAENVVTVPTSAVQRANRTSVTVLAGEQTAPRQVTVGATGPLLTEITEGLAAGELVVLADLAAPLPSADQPTAPGLGGGFGGGGAQVRPPGGRVRPGG